MESRLIKIDDSTNVLCEVYDNGRHWGHRAKLFKNGVEKAKATITYDNRTWERFQFESVIRKVIRKSCLYGEKEMDVIMGRI